MNGFTTGCAPTITPAPAAAAEATIVNDGWFPDIEPSQIRKAMRLRESVTPDRLRDALLSAILWVGTNLADWQAEQVAAGHTCLEAIPAPFLDNEHRLVLLYRRAIATAAKAELVERYRDMDLTGAGQRQVEDMDAAIGELRRDAIHAVRDLLGRTRTSVELI